MDKPDKNDAFNTAYAAQDVATGEVPTTKILWSPRLGFNWDVLGDKSLQIRGGTGLFTGRVPFVWVSNQFSNNGQLNGAYSTGSSSSSANPITNPAGIKFVADPFSQKKAEDLGKTAGRGAINVIDKDFKFPQVFRSNLAIDKTLPLGMVLTLEGIFSKTYNNVNFVNLNRKVDEAFTFVGVDQRPRYISNRVDANFDEIVKFENTNEGFSYNFVAQLQKTFQKGFVASAAYTYGHSEDLNSGTSSVAYSNWRYVNQVEGLNNLMLTRSNFDIPHRVVVFASYRLEYLNGMMSSQISVFYNGQSGQALSYIYNGDLNNDGTTNDMIYIPKSMSDINLITIPATTGTNPTPAVTPEEQWTKLDAFINGNEYLSAHRGEYAERNADHIPFQHQFDLKFLQELKMTIAGADHRFQLGIDIINIGNMLNKDWGHSNYATNQQNALINYKGLASGTSQPTYTYDGKSLINAEAYSISDFNSRWRAQVSFRYIF